MLGQSDALGIAVGFDSGAFVLLGELTSAGLTPFDPQAPRPEIPLEPLLAGLRSPEVRTVYLALLQLSRLGPRARPAVPDLLRIAGTSDDWRLRRTAVNQLAPIAPADPDVRPTLLRTLDDPNPFVRREALQALISVPGLTDADLVRIQTLKDDPDPTVARWSEIALRNIRARFDKAGT